MRCVLLALLVSVAPALATPPDLASARLQLLCTGGDALGGVLTTRGNHGSHFVVATNVAVVKLDAMTGAWTYVQHGTLVENHVNVEEPGDPPQVSLDAPAQAPPPVMQSMQRWGLTDCSPRDQRMVYGPPGPVELQVSWSAGEQPGRPKLVLSLGDEARELTASFSDPRGQYELAEQRYPTGTAPGRTTLELWGDPESESIEVLREIHLAERGVLHLRVTNEMDQTEAIAVVPLSELKAARSFLINNHGLQLHRAQDFEAAAYWFGKALEEDGSNPTARYNLACAEARRGQAEAAVEALKALPPTRALADKIKSDTDFDPIRKDAAFKRFLRRL